MIGVISEVDAGTAMRFILPRHYSGRRPVVQVAFAWYKERPLTDDNIVAACTFGKPASPPLCVGVCGPEYADNVYELNRLCRVDSWSEPLSLFVSHCLRSLKDRNWIVVSYSDMAMSHHGYIYQACNFMYTGCTKERTDMYTPNGRHPRHYEKDCQEIGLRIVRSPKHRYVYFCTRSKKLRREWAQKLRYQVLPYPKGCNSPDYKLGNFTHPQIVDLQGNAVSESDPRLTYGEQLSIF